MNPPGDDDRDVVAINGKAGIGHTSTGNGIHLDPNPWITVSKQRPGKEVSTGVGPNRRSGRPPFMFSKKQFGTGSTSGQSNKGIPPRALVGVAAPKAFVKMPNRPSPPKIQSSYDAVLSYSDICSATRVAPPNCGLSFSPSSGTPAAPRIAVPKDEFDIASGRWTNSLVGYVVGPRPYFGLLRSWIERNWCTKVTVEIHTRENGFFFFKFDNDSDCSAILRGGPWLLNGSLMVIRRWSPSIGLSRDLLSAAPLWIRFPQLPVQLWSLPILSRLSSTIGVPLSADSATANGTRLSYARCLVEIDSTSPFPSSIAVDLPDGSEMVVAVEYEKKPPLCTHCRCFGHILSHCESPTKPRPEVMASPLQPAVSPPVTEPVISSSTPPHPKADPLVQPPLPTSSGSPAESSVPKSAEHQMKATTSQSCQEGDSGFGSAIIDEDEDECDDVEDEVDIEANDDDAVLEATLNAQEEKLAPVHRPTTKSGEEISSSGMATATKLTGLVMLPLTTSYLLLEPAGCGTIEQQCDPHSTFKLAMFYLSIYIVAFGKGAGEPSIATFGADQFDEEHAHEKSAGDFFYSYFYVATNIGTLFSDTVLAYLQSRRHWALGFWISAGSAVLALVVFFSGTSRYRHFANGGNPIARFSQVIVAAWKKSSVGAPEQEDGLYEEHGGDGSAHAGRRIFQTKGFNFLDRAAIITSPLLGRSQRSAGHNPWRLCTVTQVEEAKCVFRLLPIWICTVTFSGIFVQMLSLFVEQGASMRTTVSGFHIPPASMTLFDITCSTVFIVFYKRFIAPLYTRITKAVPKGPSDLRKMGYGLIFAMASMIAAGFVEIQRKRYAMVGSDGQLSSLFILWQIPQYVLLGTGEACVHVSGLDFFGSQVPDVMRSLGIGLCLSSISVGTYFCSLILTVVMKVTTEGGRPGWIPPNLNDGLMERYFFLMTAVAAVGLALFAWFARRYESISLERSEEASESAVP